MNILGHELHFDHPGYITWGWLLVLYVCLVCVFGFLNMLALRNSYADAANLNRTTRALSWAGAAIRAGLYGLMAVFLALALAEPYEANQPTVVPSGSLHVAVSIDVSPSMGSEDYRDVLPVPVGPDGVQQPPVGPWGSRLQVAKRNIVDQMMRALPGNRIAIGVYTAMPWPQAPLLEDYSTLRGMLTDPSWIGIGAAPGGGSDYVQGLKLAIQQLREDYDPAKRQIIVVFSDGGVSFENDEEQAKWQKEYTATIAELKALKAELIVVGVGNKVPQLVPVYHPITYQRVDWFPVGAPENEKVKTALDEPALQKFAQDCGGKYVNIPVDGDGVLQVDWVNAVGGTKLTMGKKSWTWVPLACAMLVFTACMLRSLGRRGDIVPAPSR